MFLFNDSTHTCSNSNDIILDAPPQRALSFLLPWWQLCSFAEEFFSARLEYNLLTDLQILGMRDSVYYTFISMNNIYVNIDRRESQFSFFKSCRKIQCKIYQLDCLNLHSLVVLRTVTSLCNKFPKIFVSAPPKPAALRQPSSLFLVTHLADIRVVSL